MTDKPPSVLTSTGLEAQQSRIFEGPNIKVLSEFPASSETTRNVYKVEIPVCKFVPLRSLEGIIFSYDALKQAGVSPDTMVTVKLNRWFGPDVRLHHHGHPARGGFYSTVLCGSLTEDRITVEDDGRVTRETLVHGVGETYFLPFNAYHQVPKASAFTEMVSIFVGPLEDNIAWRYWDLKSERHIPSTEVDNPDYLPQFRAANPHVFGGK